MSETCFIGGSNNLLDLSGNGRNGSAIGSGPNFKTNSPVPIFGTHTMNFSNGNYFSVPNSVFTASMQTSGSIIVSWWAPEGWNNTWQTLFYATLPNGIAQISLYSPAPGQYIHVSFPSSIGTQNYDSAVGVYKPGRYYNIYYQWNNSQVKVILEDVVSQTQTSIVDTTMGGIANFSGATFIGVGANVDNGNGYSLSYGTVNTIGFYDTITSTFPRAINRKCGYWLPIGSSWITGNAGYSDNAWRKGVWDYMQNQGLNFDFQGINFNGNPSFWNVWHDAQGGRGWDWAASNIDSFLNYTFPTSDYANSNSGLIFFAQENIDAWTTLPNESTFKGYLNTIFTAVWNKSSELKVAIITSTKGSNVTLPWEAALPTYVGWMKEVCDQQNLLHPGHVILIDFSNNHYEIYDGLHPTVAGNNAIANDMVNPLYNFITAVSNVIMPVITFLKR